MKKQLVIIGIVAILVCVGLSGCSGPMYTVGVEKIDGTRDDFYIITEDQFEQLPLKIQKLFNTTEIQMRLNRNDFQTFLNISLVKTNIQGGSWRGYLQYQNVIYYLDFDDYFDVFTPDYKIAYRLDDLTVNISEQQMENFPHLKEAILQSKAIEMPRDESIELGDLLTNVPKFIRYQNEYYEVSLGSGDAW